MSRRPTARPVRLVQAAAGHLLMLGGAFTPAVRAAILDAHFGRCVSCGRPAAEVHHRAPRRAGGTRRKAVAEPHNGIGLCPACHAFAESHRELTWCVRTHQPPPAVGDRAVTALHQERPCTTPPR